MKVKDLRAEGQDWFQTIAIAVVSSALLFSLTTVLVNADDKSLRCDSHALPGEFQDRLKQEFYTWKFQEVVNLSPGAKARWESQKPIGCPGIAIGHFEGAENSYAALLVPTDNPDSAYKFLVFTPSASTSRERLKTIEQWSKGAANNFFIHQVKISDYFSSEWVRKLHAKTRDGILFADAGETEYEVDIYFWADDKFRHEPIDE